MTNSIGPRGASSAVQRAQRVDDLALIGKAAFVVFGEDTMVAGEDIEDPATAADQLGVVSKLRFDLGRQTGGPGQVVSDAAVMNDDLHFDSTALMSTAVMLS